MEPRELTPLVEALLFVSDQPLTVNALLRTIGDGDVTASHVREVVEGLAAAYEAEGRGIRLVKLGSGYQVVTRETYAPWVKELLAGRQKARLSRAALETIAVIAYKQPIGRLEIERIRGVDAGGVLNTLLERGLIMIKGRDPGPGRPLLYGTTQTFLEYFGLARLSDLPNMDEITALARQEGPVWTESERERIERHGLEADALPVEPEAPREEDLADDRAAFQEVLADLGGEPPLESAGEAAEEPVLDAGDTEGESARP